MRIVNICLSLNARAGSGRLAGTASGLMNRSHPSPRSHPTGRDGTARGANGSKRTGAPCQTPTTDDEMV